MMPALVNFYPRLCSINTLETTQDAANQPISTWIANPRLQNIPCAIQPTSGVETRQRSQIVVSNQWLIGLNGYYPTITETDQVIVDETAYNVIRIAHDDLKTATYLTVEKVGA